MKAKDAPKHKASGENRDSRLQQALRDNLRRRKNAGTTRPAKDEASA